MGTNTIALQTKVIHTTSQQSLKSRIENFSRDKIIHTIEFDNRVYQGDCGLELIHMATITYEEFPF